MKGGQHWGKYLSLFMLGVVVGGAAYAVFPRMFGVGKTVGTYKLINPVLATSPVYESLTTSERTVLENNLRELLSAAQKRDDLLQAGIFFRDLNNGPVFGINGDAKFAPASLLKVPLAIAYFREYEDEDMGILAQQIDFEGPKGTTTETYYPPPKSVEPGKRYTIKELISYMLKYSDNDATAILAQYLAPIKVNDVYKDLGVAQVENYDLYTISVRDYAAFFRILYNATYLDQASSEEVLQMLNDTTFGVGLVAGVPESVPVAHKFGERVLEKGVNQLNDCGIVYVPNRPYVLCVMAQGSNFDVLASFIKEVSSRVYTAVSAN